MHSADVALGVEQLVESGVKLSRVDTWVNLLFLVFIISLKRKLTDCSKNQNR